MALRLGELLVEQGLLTPEQVERILAAQREMGRPFGYLAEQLFGLAAKDIEAAWARQFSQITESVDPLQERVDPAVLESVSRRQAWQFGLLPIRRTGHELMVATTVEHLPRAARFVAWHLGEPVYFVITEAPRLEVALQAHYPLPGMTLGGIAARGKKRTRCA